MSWDMAPETWVVDGACCYSGINVCLVAWMSSPADFCFRRKLRMHQGNAPIIMASSWGRNQVNGCDH